MTNEMKQYEIWLEKTTGDAKAQKELQDLAGNEAEIQDRFYRDLEFGTAGLRGVLGMGSNRMNIYTVRRATQGLADYLKGSCDHPSAAIAYDSRNLSDVFAREAACVLAANGVKVHLYRELMPTPALSYAVRQLKCDSGIVITASHNPAKYNGYKAYGSDGCQIGPEQAAQVMDNIGKTDLFTGVKRADFEKALESGMIEFIPDSFVRQFVGRVLEEAIRPEVCAKAGLKLVYTPLNGAGNRCVKMVLGKAGVQDITTVPEQEQPDGNFPTCPYPNPEMPEALELGFRLCQKTGADLLLATDPDADRVAIAVKNGDEYRILTGNEVGILLLDYIARSRKELGTLPENPVTVKSIVSSKLADAVAAEHGVEMVSVLTGFKFIGEVILGLEQKREEDRFIFAFEESCGYLSGGYVRDKDAIDASLLIVEMASYYKLQGKTLINVLEDIYSRHGIYRNLVESYAFEGADGMAKMSGIMEALRQNPPSQIAGQAITCRSDYQASVKCAGGNEEPILLPRSNVLEYELENGCSVIVRPSGTEPKIKLYYSIVGKTAAQVDAVEQELTVACRKLIGV